MAKYLFEDMVKHSGPEAKKEIKPISKIKAKEILEIRETIEIKETSKKGINYVGDRSRYMLWILAGVSLVFCLFALSFLFGNAKVLIYPKIEDVVLNENLSAELNSNNNGLFFDLVVMEGEESKILQATEEKDVAVKAMGTVVIYNTFNSSSQTLSIDTRLEGSNGKIYKTQTKVTVPGKAKDGAPGKVEVGIYAAEAGVEYNSIPLDFKILGFKGTPKYSKFYGRTKTGTEITGGYKGKSPTVSEADKTATVLELKTTLEDKLLKKVATSGFILFKDAVFFNIDSIDIPFTAKDGNLTITMKGTLRGVLLNEQKLTKKIAEKKVQKYDGSDVYIPNIKDLIFSLPTGQTGLSNKENISFENIKNINFNLSGSAKIVWKLDEDKFTADLLGKAKKDFNQILSQYESINSATLTLSPFWKRSIPDEKKDIKIIVNYPE